MLSFVDQLHAKQIIPEGCKTEVTFLISDCFTPKQIFPPDFLLHVVVHGKGVPNVIGPHVFVSCKNF